MIKYTDGKKYMKRTMSIKLLLIITSSPLYRILNPIKDIHCTYSILYRVGGVKETPGLFVGGD